MLSRNDSNPDIHYGTPVAADAATQVTLTIDGTEVSVPAGSSVMRAAIQAGVQVPKLCATDSLEPWGSCAQTRRTFNEAQLEYLEGAKAGATKPALAGGK